MRIEIKYLSKNKKGFSIEDIKQKDFNGKNNYFINLWEKKWYFGFILNKIQNVWPKQWYVIVYTLPDWKWYTEELDRKSITKAKEKLKEFCIKMGLKEKEKNETLKIEKINDNLNDVDLNISNNKNIDLNIVLEFAEKDFRWNFRGILNNKIIFREKTKENFDARLKEIKNFFSNWDIVTEETTWLPFKIDKNKYLEFSLYTILQWWDKEEYFINSNYLESPLSKAKYVSSNYKISKEKTKQIINNLEKKDKEKYNFLYILFNQKDKINFTQDTYFKELLEAYNATKSWFEDSIIKITNLSNLKWNEFIVEDWTHRILALLNFIKEYKETTSYFKKWDLERLIIELFSTKIKLVESKMKTWWYFTIDQLSTINIKEIDETPSNSKILKYLTDRSYI